MQMTEWVGWLRGWLSRHPVKEPPQGGEAMYTQQVMHRVRTATSPIPARAWLGQPRWVFALGTAVACTLAVVVLVNQSPSRLAAHLERDWQVLTELDEFLELNGDDLDEEIQRIDQLILAESLPADDDIAWIEGAFDLLDGVDASDDLDDWVPYEEEDRLFEELLDELQWLDEVDLASS